MFASRGACVPAPDRVAMVAVAPAIDSIDGLSILCDTSGAQKANDLRGA
jgi:hypothetical protein